MVRLTSSSSTAKIVVSVDSLIDDFNLSQIPGQVIQRFLNITAAPHFGRALEGDANAGDLVEAVAAARSFQAVRHSVDGFEIVRCERAFDRCDILAPVFHETRHQLLEIRVHTNLNRVDADLEELM